MNPLEGITAEQFYIAAFTSFFEDLEKGSEGTEDAKKVVEYYRATTGEKNGAIDAMLLAYVAGMIKGGEIEEILNRPKAQA